MTMVSGQLHTFDNLSLRKVLLEPMDMTAGLERGNKEKIFASAGN
jgi:hypothetical protein